MAGSLVRVSFFMFVLSLLCCVSVADSRAAFFGAKFVASVADEYGIDDGPQTFTMQDHFNFLRDRELARRARGDTLSGTLEATLHVDPEEDEQEPIFVEDYFIPDSNKLHDFPGS